MNIKIASVQISYEEGGASRIQVFFNGHDENHSVRLDGYIPLTTEQYEGNESYENLLTLVKQEVSDRVLG